MEFHERIGTMVFTPTGQYIIGASDKENEEFQKKGQNIIDIGQRDIVELSCVRQIEIPSENYNDYTKTSEMPNHCFSDNYGTKLQKEIQAAIRSYVNGEMTDEEIKKVFIDMCKDMRVYQAQSGHTSGVDKKDNQQIIEDVYEIFQKANVECMVDACFEAGRAIADTQGGAEKDNWIYYDSEYYLKSQNLQSLLQNASNEMSSEWDTDSIDFEKIEKESKFTVNGGLDFNSVWNWRANLRGICSISTEEWVADNHFSLFYQENKNAMPSKETTLESQAGVCIITFGNNKWTLEVPFNGSTLLGKLADHFNVKELFTKNEQYVNSTLFSYLEKFDIYTRFFGHNKEIRGE